MPQIVREKNYDLDDFCHNVFNDFIAAVQLI